MTKTLDIRKLLEQGQAAQNAEHAEAEIAKQGNLRGGSAGVIGTDNKIYGECHRLALSRLMGADKEVEANRHIMFDAGNAAEDSWAAKLKAAGVEFRRESEIPIVWKIPGTERIVTGRPDIVIGKLSETELDPETAGMTNLFVPAHGLELKGIYSASSGVRVDVEGVPDPKHLAQAGFYAMALNIPYTLCYTNPSVIEVPYWAQKKLGAPKKLQPFYRLFDLRWTDVLEYRDEQKEDWVRTVYTQAGIAAYYALIVEMEQTKQLGPRPLGGWADGGQMPFDKCNYCAAKSACAQYDADKDFDAWISSLKP